MLLSTLWPPLGRPTRGSKSRTGFSDDVNEGSTGHPRGHAYLTAPHWYHALSAACTFHVLTITRYTFSRFHACNTGVFCDSPYQPSIDSERRPRLGWTEPTSPPARALRVPAPNTRAPAAQACATWPRTHLQASPARPGCARARQAAPRRTLPPSVRPTHAYIASREHNPIGASGTSAGVRLTRGKPIHTPFRSKGPPPATQALALWFGFISL